MKQAFYITFTVTGSGSRRETGWCWSPAMGESPSYGTTSQLKQVVSGLAEATSITLLLPGENIFLASVNIPAKQASQIRLAAPYVIEEQLACDPDKLHIVTRRNNQTGKVDIVGVDRLFLSTCLEELETINVFPQQAYVDVLSLGAAEPGSLILSQQKMADRILLRWGTHQGTAMPGGLLADWLPLFLREQTEPVITRLLIDSSEQQPELIEAVSADIPGIEVEYRDLSSHSDPAEGINLLSGEFRPLAAEAGKQNWRKPLSLAAVATVLIVMTAYIGLYRDTAQLKMLDVAIENTFRDAFPAVKRIEDPMIQARQQLALLGHAGTGSSGFLTRMNEFSLAFKQQPGVIVNSLDYRDHKLEVKLHSANIGELEALAETIRRQGGGAVLSSVSLGKNGVDARLLLTGPGA